MKEKEGIASALLILLKELLLYCELLLADGILFFASLSCIRCVCVSFIFETKFVCV